MGFTEPDSPPPPAGVPQMPGAPNAGPAPAPYTGPDELGQVHYAATGVSFTVPSVEVLNGSSGNAVQQSGYAYDVNAGLVADFSPGAISPIQMPGPGDAGGRDDVSATVAGAVANAEARYLEHEGDTHGTGGAVGDILTLPPGPLDPGAAPGEAAPSGSFYDPPRSY
jgi:hypothetical protein